MSINSYPSVWQYGHKAITDLLRDEVVIEEKVDGSQFSFGVIDGVLECRSHNRQIDMSDPDKMFGKAIETAKELANSLIPGWIYRGEYLQKPKHNTICYDRTPTKSIILYDIQKGIEDYLTYDDLCIEATRIGLEVVPLYATGKFASIDDLRPFLDRKSVLGDVQVEGIVIKNYSLFTVDKKVAMGKIVNTDFIEKNQTNWRTGIDIIGAIGGEYRNEARWQKSVQHLAEDGLLKNEASDIGLLFKYVTTDILKECESEIKDKLFNHYWKDISKTATRGLPEWYKQKLMGLSEEDL
jgi:hypothetical protein